MGREWDTGNREAAQTLSGTFVHTGVSPGPLSGTLGSDR